ncbi:MAG: substrate-binding domain-containing protein [Planctomycetaceae bacterium]
MPRRRKARHVAVLIETSRAFGRGLIEGVNRYSRQHGDWYIYFEPRGLEAPPAWLEGWKGDGILSRVPNRSMAQAMESKGVPVVHLHHTTISSFPMVGADNVSIARMAFDHLWEKGLRQFAYCGLSRHFSLHIHDRGERFRGLVEAAGCACAVFPVRKRSGLKMADWEREQRQMASWLSELPKPVGVLACFDERAFQVLAACRYAGLRVPEEVAVIGTGNDTLLCDMCLPPLSSIDLDAPRIGYEAAGLLERMMRGDSPPRRSIFISPYKLVPRASTDILAIADAEVVAALQFIRHHASAGVNVDDVVRHVAISQCVLDRRFKRMLGRSPKAELLRVQINRAKELLVESDLPIKLVAERSGFGSERYFSDAFRRGTGIRPGAFRRQHRRSPA